MENINNMTGGPLGARVTQPPAGSAMPPNRPPAPIRVDEEALARALTPVVKALERMATAAEKAAQVIAEGNALSVRGKRPS